jgi:hypothetical protein
VSHETEAAQEVATLRLPVPFFDLLMVLLVTCLVFVQPLRPEGDVEALDIPIAQGKGGGSATSMLAVIPKQVAGGWTFEISGSGEVLAADALALRATDGRKVVLVVPSATPLQEFVDMQAALSAQNIPFALAIRNKDTAS